MDEDDDVDDYEKHFLFPFDNSLLSLIGMADYGSERLYFFYLDLFSFTKLNDSVAVAPGAAPRAGLLHTVLCHHFCYPCASAGG